MEQKINEKVTEMEKESYHIKTMSFLGTEKAVLVFKKGLKGSLPLILISTENRCCKLTHIVDVEKLEIIIKNSEKQTF